MDQPSRVFQAGLYSQPRVQAGLAVLFKSFQQNTD